MRRVISPSLQPPLERRLSLSYPFPPPVYDTAPEAAEQPPTREHVREPDLVDHAPLPERVDPRGLRQFAAPPRVAGNENLREASLIDNGPLPERVDPRGLHLHAAPLRVAEPRVPRAPFGCPPGGS